QLAHDRVALLPVLPRPLFTIPVEEVARGAHAIAERLALRRAVPSHEGLLQRLVEVRPVVGMEAGAPSVAAPNATLEQVVQAAPALAGLSQEPIEDHALVRHASA